MAEIGQHLRLHILSFQMEYPVIKINSKKSNVKNLKSMKRTNEHLRSKKEALKRKQKEEDDNFQEIVGEL